MKRFLTMIVAISSILVAMAQNPMVTLSHNGELSFFTNLNALPSAVDAAEDGDILYLSDGDFVLNDGSCEIKKHLSFVGSGYKSHILGTLSFDLSYNPSNRTNPLLFDGVRLEKLEFAAINTSASHLKETEIRRSWISTIEGGDAGGTNILYENCFIETVNFDYGIGEVLLKNSKIKNIRGDNSYRINVKNCNVNSMVYYPQNMISSILENVNGAPDVAGPSTLLNCVLNQSNIEDEVKAYNCYFRNEYATDANLEPKVDLSDYIGTDGTVVGIYGGESPFSENPSLPTVDTSKSSVEYDAAGNKLKVSISVKAD